MRKIRRKQVGRRRLVAERLEQRAMLAGDVDFFVDGGGNLRINGDGAANGVDLFYDGTSFTIQGKAGTTLNNGTILPLTLTPVAPPVTGDVLFKMAGGDDDILLFTIGIGDVLPRGLGIELEGGNDTATVDGPVASYMKIQGQTGNDTVNVVFTTVEGDFDLDTGAGNDTASIRFSDFLGKAVIDMNSGDDFLSIATCDFFGKVKIETNTGNDSVGIRAGSSFFGGLNLDTGVGNDTVIIGATFFAGVVEIGMGRGDDSLTIAASDFTFATNVRLKGEQDFDTLSDDVGNIGYAPIKTGFELDI